MKIHPFQDGNGRVGRLIMFKECLRNGITPFIIEDDIKEFYNCHGFIETGEKEYEEDTTEYLLKLVRKSQSVLRKYRK